jgi:putative ABC transport system ATP-binding protein
LLHLMGTLERPTAGRIAVSGVDVARLNDRELAALRATEIGFVFQMFFLAEHSTLLENVADGLLYTSAPAAARRRLALEVLAAVGLAGRASARPTHLSGGERQRIAIARALIGKPSIVLADEPTGNLDTATGEQIISLLDELNAAGATIVVITHDWEIAARFPRLIQLRDGRIITDEARPAIEPGSARLRREAPR